MSTFLTFKIADGHWTSGVAKLGRKRTCVQCHVWLRFMPGMFAVAGEICLNSSFGFEITDS